MITRFRSQFRSRDAAWAAAKRLSHLVPAHDYEAWPDRGYWVLVMRYCDDDGHLRFKFVGHEDLSLPKSRFERTDDVARQGSTTSPNRSIGRVQGASFPSETCVRISL